jgi:multidrug efflux pump subunit AcrB
MFQTLERVNAALARVQAELPPTAKVTANRLTFAAFPIIGYSLTSDTVPLTRLWELATYELKPRLNRKLGVTTVVVQGGQEPEFEIEVNPAKMLQTGITVPAVLDAVGRSNLIDSPGLFENNHQLVLSLVSGQARTEEDLANIVVKTTPLGVPVRIGDIAAVSQSIKPVYTIVTANMKPAVLLNVFRQPDSNTVAVATQSTPRSGISARAAEGVVLEPFYDQSNIVGDRSERARP